MANENWYSDLVRRSKTDRIGTMLKQQRSGGPQIIKAGSLPTNPGPVDIPPVGPSNIPPGPVVTFGPGNYPVSGTNPPSGEYTTSPGDRRFLPDPNQGAGFFRGTGTGSYDTGDPSGGGFRGGFSTGGLSAAGPFPGGNMGGPQGSVYGINPVTGNTIYNVTGSPRPGFFDSTAGKVVKGVGSAALNMFIPGLGFVSSRVFDAIRNRQNQKNTGTDLSGNYRPPTAETAPTFNPDPSAGKTLFGFVPPSGPPTFRYDYGSGRTVANNPTNPLYNSGSGWRPIGGAPADVRWAENSGTGNAQASAATQAYLLSGGERGNPNNTRSFATEGRFLLDAEGTPTMQGPKYGDRRNEFRRPQGGPAPYASNQAAVSEWLMKQPAYIKYMQGKGG